MTNDANMRERLSDIWDAWTLTPEDDATIEKHHEVLPVVASWLESGTNDPEIVIRAVQLLLADPEHPDLNRRECWKTARKALSGVWKSAGTGNKPFFYVQALLLAGWPQGAEGHFRAKPLMDSAWDIQERRTLKEIAEWRNDTPPLVVKVDAISEKKSESKLSATTNTRFDGVGVDVTAPMQIIEQWQGYSEYHRVGAQITQVFKAHNQAIAALSTALVTATTDIGNVPGALNELLDHLNSIAKQWDRNVQETLQTTHCQLNLLWWGQSRYSHTLRKPYRRLKSDKSALLWWATREAAELSQSVDVEPAAAYLVQTLEDLGQNVDEKKPVLEWMQQLHATLLQYGTDVPALSSRLDQIASVDALGLPITWVRRQAAQKEPFHEEEAINDVALPLDKTIDLGDWASWIFRETLLDLHLAENK